MFTDKAMKTLSAQENQYREGVKPPRRAVFPFTPLQVKDTEAGKVTSNGNGNQDPKKQNHEEEKPKLSTLGSILLLAGATIITGVTAEFLVSFSRFGVRARV